MRVFLQRVMPARTPVFTGIVLVALLFFFSVAQAAAPFSGSSDEPVQFKAKTLSHDDKAQTVTAEGDVELVQGGKILHADKMIYNLETDTVSAIGNVSLLDETGDVHFAEYVELSKNMKDGYVHSLLSMLADGSRFTAVEGKREGGIKTTMLDASYTPCKVCETDPKPLWQIKADKIVHDAETKTVKYQNARMEFLGIPVAYSPIFSHADPSVKRKSGFLRPEYGWSSDLGTHIKGGYYFGGIAPDKDATLMVMPTTLKGTLVEGQWRQRFENGRLQIDASGVQSDRKEQDGRVEQDKLRGHVFANGAFDLDNQWRAGFDVKRVTDRQYLRLYDISRENVLNNELYAERFSGRDYSRVSALSFQDVRLGNRPEQPALLPLAEHNMLGEPGSLLGGRWSAGVSSAVLTRDKSGQDVQRVSAETGWQRRDITPQGIVTKLDFNAREDMYAVQHSAITGNSGNTSRGSAVASLTTSYPVSRRLSGAEMVVEPIAGASISPQLNASNRKVPNEDSIDVQLDASNLFEDNRFPGVDRIEDGARVNYGLKTGIYGDDGRHGKVFVGQSYRFDEDGLFPQNSGLDGNASDIVGQVSVGLSRYLDVDYKFQLDNSDLSAHRHELKASTGNEVFNLNTRYIYVDNTGGTGFTEAREQANINGSYKLTKNWSLSGSTLVDLGEQPGLRKATAGFGYTDECFTFSAQGTRNLISQATGESETLILLRVGFKNIGEFSAPQIMLKGSGQNN